MASEVLAIPEEHLAEVIKIIRSGLAHKGHVTKEVRDQLKQWCDEEEEYLSRLNSDDD
jgi:hypothetical protein